MLTVGAGARCSATHAPAGSDLYPRYGIQLRSAADLAAARRDGDDRPERHPGRELHRGRRPGPGPLRRGERISAGSRCGRSTGTASAARHFPRPGCCPTRAAAPPSPACSSPRSSASCRACATVTSSAGDVQPAVANTNPADAPYPQWSATGDYPRGYKVVEDGEIYQAKWYNTGDDPQAQVQYSWQTPWELLGPVLPGDHAPVIAKLSRRHLPGLVDQRPSTRPATRCSTRACRTRPSGTTRESPRRASRATRPAHRGRRCTRSPASPSAPRRRCRRLASARQNPANQDHSGRTGHGACPRTGSLLTPRTATPHCFCVNSMAASTPW